MAGGSVNKVILVGNLGADPEMRYTPSGLAVANLRLATSEKWKDKQTGENQEKTEWHRIVLYQRLAEIAGEYLRKGAKVYIEGRLQTRKWQDKNTGQDRYTTEIVGDALQMLDSRIQAGASPDAQPSTAAFEKSAGSMPPFGGNGASASADRFDDEIPF